MSRNEYMRQYRANNPDYRKKARELRKRWGKQNPEKVLNYAATARDRNRKFLDEQKSAPCMDCGQKFPPCVMDFDHVRGVKCENVGLMSGYGQSIETLKKEIAKCDLVCANCHRIRTHARGTYRSK